MLILKHKNCKGNRSKLEIKYDILMNLRFRTGKKISYVLFFSNTNYKTFIPILNEFIESGIVTEEKLGRMRLIKLTRKGLNVKNELKKFLKMI